LDRYSVEPTEEENTKLTALIDEASGKEWTLLRPIPKSLEFVKAAKKLEWNRALAKT
jgi:hypothetical protein